MSFAKKPQLEIWFSNKQHNIKVPLVDLGHERFMIKTKDHHINTLEFLQEWSQDNATLSEKKYSEYIANRFKSDHPAPTHATFDDNMACVATQLEAFTKKLAPILEGNQLETLNKNLSRIIDGQQLETLNKSLSSVTEGSQLEALNKNLSQVLEGAQVNMISTYQQNFNKN